MTSDDYKNMAKDAAGQIGQSSSEASDTAKGIAADLKGNAQETAARVGDHAKSIADQASNTASDLYDRAADGMRKVADSVPASASDAVAKGQRVLEGGGSQIAGQVKKQPLEALILAAAIGYLVGWATNRG